MRRQAVRRALRGVAYILLGGLLFLMPDTVLSALVRVIAAAVLAIGVLVLYIGLRVRNSGEITQGSVIALTGGILFYAPRHVISLFPAVMGILILLWGLGGMLGALECRIGDVGNWRVMMGSSVLTLLCGLTVLRNPFTTVRALVRLIGAVTVYNGISGLWLKQTEHTQSP